jgi:group I intron endonuclease
MNFLLPLLVGGPDINSLLRCREKPNFILFKRDLFSSNYLLSRRYYSSKVNSAVYLGKVRYENADTQKEMIYKDNRGKTGIYRWTNLLNGNTYIGSSTNLAKRFTLYFSLTYLQKQAKKNSIICRALLKNGHSNFSLEILEYCDPKVVIEREQYYMDLLSPEYNVLKFAGSSLGYKQSEETLAKLRGRTLSPETLEKRKSYTSTEEYKIKMSIAMKAAVSEFNVTTKGVKVVVFNLETRVSENYPSIRSAAQALGAHMETIRRCIKANKLYLNKYSISIQPQKV